MTTFDCEKINNHPQLVSRMQNTDKKTILTSIIQEFGKYMEYLDAEESTLDATTIERELLNKLISIGRASFAYKLQVKQKEIDAQPIVELSGVRLINKGQEDRHYLSIFGEIVIKRKRYYHKSIGNYHPFDELMGLPKDKMSFTLKDWLGRQSSEEDYRQSVDLLNEIFHLNLHSTESSRNLAYLSSEVPAFYNEIGVKPVAQSNVICFQCDGKGVPIIQSEREISQVGTEERARLMKGEKRGVKKTATVCVTSHLKPRIRDKESVLKGLFRESDKVKEKKAKLVQDSNWHEDIHRRAYMNNQKGSINYGIHRIKQMHKGTTCDIVALIDAGIGLEENIRQSLEESGLTAYLTAIILDIVHVSEYVWKAANAILGEKSILRTEWVRDCLSDLLESKTEKVILQLKDNLLKVKLTESAKNLLNKTITYFENHKNKMNYKYYLKMGYPISTALAESTCGHLVKDRMEHSGMRWTIKGAQNMLDVRAVKKNGDWAVFMEFVKKNNFACAA